MAIDLTVNEHSTIPLNVESNNGTDFQHSEEYILAVSPTAKVEQTETGVVITVKDKFGTTSAVLLNGQDGADGQNGKDGQDGAQGPKGDTGPAGSDADVTAENIESALGYVPADDTKVVSSVNGKTGTVTLTAEDIGAMEGMTILSYGHSTWAEFLEAYEANRIVYCKASSNSNPATGLQGRMAFFAYVQFTSQGYSTSKAEFQYYRSVSAHTNAQQGDQVFCYSLRPENGGTWSVETRQASSRVIAGTGLASAYTRDKLTLSLDADYKSKIDTLWADYQSRTS